jgi:hypothetical protein
MVAAHRKEEPTLRDGLQDRRDSEAAHRDSVATERDNVALRRGILADERDALNDSRNATAAEIKGLWACLTRIETGVNATNALVNTMYAKGCAKAEAHEARENQHESRIQTIEIAMASNPRIMALEVAMAENRGRDRTLNALIATGISAACVFFGRMFKQ